MHDAHFEVWSLVFPWCLVLLGQLGGWRFQSKSWNAPTERGGYSARLALTSPERLPA